MDIDAVAAEHHAYIKSAFTQARKEMNTRFDEILHPTVDNTLRRLVRKAVEMPVGTPVVMRWKVVSDYAKEVAERE